MAGDELVQADCLETPIGFGDCARLDQSQRGDRGCLFEGHELILSQLVLAGQHDGHAVPLMSGLDRLHANPQLAGPVARAPQRRPAAG